MALEYKKNLVKEHGRYVCPHNEECRCRSRDCWRCGWNPKVAEKRRAKLEERMGVAQR